MTEGTAKLIVLILWLIIWNTGGHPLVVTILKVSGYTGINIELQDNKQTVLHLKHELAKVWNKSPQSQKIVYDKRILDDNFDLASIQKNNAVELNVVLQDDIKEITVVNKYGYKHEFDFTDDYHDGTLNIRYLKELLSNIMKILPEDIQLSEYPYTIYGEIFDDNLDLIHFFGQRIMLTITKVYKIYGFSIDDGNDNVEQLKTLFIPYSQELVPLIDEALQLQDEDEESVFVFFMNGSTDTIYDFIDPTLSGFDEKRGDILFYVVADLDIMDSIHHNKNIKDILKNIKD